MCNARAARSRSAEAITTEIRIVEVEIISMLTPSSASVRNILAAMPGDVYIPAPTRETLAMSLS